MEYVRSSSSILLNITNAKSRDQGRVFGMNEIGPFMMNYAADAAFVSSGLGTTRLLQLLIIEFEAE